MREEDVAVEICNPFGMDNSVIPSAKLLRAHERVVVAEL